MKFERNCKKENMHMDTRNIYIEFSMIDSGWWALGTNALWGVNNFSKDLSKDEKKHVSDSKYNLMLRCIPVFAYTFAN
jgi:uncharacterized membrane protein SpoIIM required for sporulation